MGAIRSGEAARNGDSRYSRRPCPPALTGVSGIASVDAYTQPACPFTCRLAVGPSHGLVFWRTELTR